jgi:hypothetical protein
MPLRMGELKQVREAEVAEKKKLKDKLAEEKRKNREADTLFNTMSSGKTNLYI